MKTPAELAADEIEQIWLVHDGPLFPHFKIRHAIARQFPTSSITITKRSNGDYVLSGPNGEGVAFEQAFHVIGQVRTWLNLLKLPAPIIPEAEQSAK